MPRNQWHLDQRGWQIQNPGTSEKLRNYKVNPQESEANSFASELLMLTSMVRPIVESHEPVLRQREIIASEFNVSVTAAAIRMFLEAQHACFLVLSQHCHVSWWISVSELYGIWLESKQPLHPLSVAYHLDPGTTCELQTVACEAWFPHLPHPEKIEITEDSMFLGNTGLLLSLLTIGDAD